MATDLERLIVQVDAKLTGLERQMARMSRVTDQAAKKTESRIQAMAAKLRSTVAQMDLGGMIARGLATAGITVGAAEIARAIGSASAAYTGYINQLRVAGLSSAEAGATFNRLLAIAQQQGAAIGPLVTLYGQLAGAQKELGVSGAEMERFSAGVAMALQVAGSDAAAASGALLQLSQAMGGGIVRAEEFNSVLEGARPILTTVAAGMAEAGGSVSQLRNLVNDGKVSSEAFFRAFLAGLPQLQAQSASASGTVAQATARIENAFVALVGKLDETAMVSQTAAANLSSVADVIGSLGGVIDGAVGWLDSLNGALNAVGSNAAWGYIFGIGQPNAAQAKAAGLLPLNVAGMSAEDQARAALAKQLAAGQTHGAAGATDWLYGARPAGATAQIKPISIAQYPAGGAKSGGGTGGGRRGGAGGAGGQSEAEKEAEAVRKVVEQYKFKADQLSRTAEQQDLYEELQRAGVTLESEHGQAIQTAVTAYQAKQAEIEKTQAAQDSLNSTMQFFGDAAVDSLSALIEGGTSAEDVIRRLAVSLAQAAAQAILLGQGPLAGLFGTATSNGAVGGLIGMLTSGIAGKASGGPISGAGTGTSDSIPIMASNGEYMIRAAQARKYRPLLDAINSGRIGHFSGGGLVGAIPSLPSLPAMSQVREAAQARGSVAQAITYAPQIDARGADVAAVARLERAMAQDRAAFASNVVRVVGDARSRRIVR